MKPRDSQLCLHCHVRWRQGRTGLCARCQNEERDAITELMRQTDEQRIAEYAATAATANQPTVIRTVTIGREEFDIVWDGSRR